MAKLRFKFSDGHIEEVEAEIGDSILTIAHRHNIPLEGACEGSLACSTCHVIFEDEAVFTALPDMSEDEEDMLDLAYGVSQTSRLGCQITMTETLDGVTLLLPEATRNMMLEG